MDENKDDHKSEKKEEEKKQESNLWREFLKNAVSTKGRGLQNTGHLVIFGSPNAGKTSLVGQFKKLESKFGEMKRFLMMRYAYLHLTTADSEDSYSLLNIWQIAEPSHADVLSVVIPENEMDRVAYMICVDLSKPSSVQSEYNKWMGVLETIQNKLIGRCREPVQRELMNRSYKHIQFYVNPKDDTDQIPDDQKDSLEIQTENPCKNLGCPIIVVACKCDSFRKHYPVDAEAEDHFENMCSYLRWWSFDYGAACFSMAKGQKEQARRILQYIDHRIFDSKFDRGPNAVVKLSNLSGQFLFVPSGYDTKDTIKAQNPTLNLEKDEFEDKFQSKEKKKKTRQDKPKMQSDDNDKFLKVVEFDLKNDDRPHTKSSRAQPRKQGPDNGVNINDFFQKLLQPNAGKVANK